MMLRSLQADQRVERLAELQCNLNGQPDGPMKSKALQVLVALQVEWANG